MDSSTNRSNAGDRPVRLVAVFADGRVSHRDLSKGRAPWQTGAGWGRAGAHAMPSDAPSPQPERVKDPRKVAAGKARAAKAKAAREAEAAKAKGTPKKKAPASPFPTVAKKAKATPAKKKAAKGEGNPGAMKVVAFRADAKQRAKLKRLGGGDWIRTAIDKAALK